MVDSVKTAVEAGVANAKASVSADVAQAEAVVKSDAASFVAKVSAALAAKPFVTAGAALVVGFICGKLF